MLWVKRIGKFLWPGLPGLTTKVLEMPADCAITRFGCFHLHTQGQSAIAVSACLHWWRVAQTAAVGGSNVVTAISHLCSVGLLCANTECTHSWGLTVCERLLWNEMSYPEDNFRDPSALIHASSHKITQHFIPQATLCKLLLIKHWPDFH